MQKEAICEHGPEVPSCPMGQGSFKMDCFKVEKCSMVLFWHSIPLYIRSNHFYCHITTAHVPWWVKLLRACSRQCRNNLHIDSTYLQTYTEDNVQNTHTYTQYTQCTIRHTYSNQYTLYTLCTHSTLCTHTVGMESIQTPLNFSLFVILQPFAQII